MRDKPKDSFSCWVISEDKRISALRLNKPFSEYNPDCYFKLVERIDNNFIQGFLGNTSDINVYHESIVPRFDYFNKYESRESVYFSFDNISLYKLIEIHPSNPLSFILKRIDKLVPINQNKVFIIMPFKSQELNLFYQKYIKDFLFREMKIETFRADDFSGNDIIIDTIYNQIEHSEFIIADTSFENKNAFFELGYAVAKEKEVITIQDKNVEQSLFFDRAHIRAILYSKNDIEDFQQQLKNSILAIRDKLSNNF